MSEYTPFFVGWPLVISAVIAIRLINYYFKQKEQKNVLVKDLPTLKEIGFASSEVFVYNGMAYWMENGKVHRAKHQDVVHVNTKEIVDPLGQKDLEMDEYMAILSRVESMSK